ncbi:uncharacterized protein [Ptychodera flava]|uniref:uncharacterized protein n=1 Tax=Ptychodera flava TaxID=63121 RepID=UPI00396A5EE3
MDTHRQIFCNEIRTKSFLVLCFVSCFSALALFWYGSASQQLPLIAHNLRPITRTRATGTARTPASRYLMPAYIFPKSGPQHIYVRFTKILPLVAFQNRTLVAFPIRNHITQDNASKARDLSDTFDIELLKQFVPVVTPYEFFRQCSGSAVVVVRGKNTSGNLLREIYRDTGLLFQAIELDKENSKKKLTFERRPFFLWEYPCIIYRPPRTLYYNVTQWEETAKEANRYVKKAPYIRSMGEQGGRHICKGERYLAFHWRNRSGERCTMWGRKQFCNFTRLNLIQESPQLVKAFKDYMELQKISCVYMAFPPFAKRMYDILRPHIPQLYTKEDLIKTVPSIDAYKNDNFVVSLVEQEIIKRADIFIGCRKSAWTHFAKSERDSMNRSTIYLNSVEGMPKVVSAIND